MLPLVPCVLVTRRCNARCRFCFEPSGDYQPEVATILRRLDWLLANGAEGIHFCGGEPTLHPDLPKIVRHVRHQGASVRITTNGLVLSVDLLEELHDASATVKVSLHGDRLFHDRMVGVEGFSRTVLNLRRLLAAGVRTFIQTTVFANETWVLEWTARFCRKEGVRRLSILPFVPRGERARECSDLYMSPQRRYALRDLVKHMRRRFSGGLDIRWLDFNQEPYLVVDTEGRAMLREPNWAGSRLVFRIPEE